MTKKVDDNFLLFGDAELSDSERRSIEESRKKDPAISNTLTALHGLQRTLSELPMLSPSTAFVDSIMDEIQKPRKRYREVFEGALSIRSWSVAGACSLAMALTIAFYSSSQASSFDYTSVDDIAESYAPSPESDFSEAYFLYGSI